MAAIAKRHKKYFWLCAPSLLSIAVFVMWLGSVAPKEQEKSRALHSDLTDIAGEKARQDALRDADLGTDFKRLFLNGFVIGKSDPKTIVPNWITDPRVYGADQVIELKDTYDGCIGFIAYQAVYTEEANPGMCELSQKNKEQFYTLLNQLRNR